jgi:hypothetical protein
MDGTAHGAESVRAVVDAARRYHEDQQLAYAGPGGDDRFVEDCSCSVRCVPTHVIVLVTFNAAGQTQQLVVNHRPRSALLHFSRPMLEHFAGTPLAKHREGTP